MRYPFRDDYAVRVWSEEREADIPETAHFFKEIYHITLWGLISHLRFVPAFSRLPEYWPVTWPKNVDIVHSEHEARLFMAGLAYMAVTPDDKLAGQKEFFPLPPPMPGFSASWPDKGVLFFVTVEEYDLFNEELRQIGKQTVFVTEYLRLSTVRHLSVIKYILGYILPFEREWRKQWLARDKSLQKLKQEREMSPIPVGAHQGRRQLAVA